jgi:hypothetical protein
MFNTVDEMEGSESTYDVYSVAITTGTHEAGIHFSLLCGDGTRNTHSRPCANKEDRYIPKLKAIVTSHAKSKLNPYETSTYPLEFNLQPEGIYCSNSWSKEPCDGKSSVNCTCSAKLSPLPPYLQLRVVVMAEDHLGEREVGKSSLFVLTDVATVPLLRELYGVPPGLTIRHGANQAVAEFYGQFYSNDDLSAFSYLSGLQSMHLPNDWVKGTLSHPAFLSDGRDSNIAKFHGRYTHLHETYYETRLLITYTIHNLSFAHTGNLNNDPKMPGSESTLDIQYMMAFAPGAETSFYSMGDLNPYSPTNEGFLPFLYDINAEEEPPQVGPSAAFFESRSCQIY